ncbi:MAG: hypothetical protein ACLTBV_15020 [Enterocloster bolteae]
MAGFLKDIMLKQGIKGSYCLGGDYRLCCRYVGGRLF